MTGLVLILPLWNGISIFQMNTNIKNENGISSNCLDKKYNNVEIEWFTKSVWLEWDTIIVPLWRPEWLNTQISREARGPWGISGDLLLTMCFDNAGECAPVTTAIATFAFLLHLSFLCFSKGMSSSLLGVLTNFQLEKL